jgi:uncharacterized membrane protein
MAHSFRPRIAVAGVPVHAMLVPFPIACFTGALLTDIAYSRTALMQWSNFSAWLLAFGLMMGVLAALFGFIDYFGAKPRPAIGAYHLIGNVVVLVLALFNNLVHTRDGWTSVVPTGLILSAVTVALMVITGFLGHRMAYAHVDRELRA